MIAIIHTVDKVNEFIQNKIETCYSRQANKVTHYVFNEWLEKLEKGIKFDELYLEFEETINQLFIANEKVLITCSSLGNYVKKYKEKNGDSKIYRIDYPMLSQAGSIGKNIALVVTNEMTIEPSSNVILDTAKKHNKTINLEVVNIAKEVKEIQLNDNNSLGKKISEMLSNYDMIVLAQVSISIALNKIFLDIEEKNLLQSYETGLKQIFDEERLI